MLRGEGTRTFSPADLITQSRVAPFLPIISKSYVGSDEREACIIVTTIEMKNVYKLYRWTRQQKRGDNHIKSEAPGHISFKLDAKPVPHFQQGTHAGSRSASGNSSLGQ